MGSNHTYRYLNVDVSDIEPANLASTLQASSWQAIAYHASIGDLSDHFSVGDTKTLQLSAIANANNYGTDIASQTITMVLADFNHVDASYLGSETGTVDFICKDCIGTKTSNDVYGKCGFSTSFIRTFLNWQVLRALPSNCSKYIIDKTVVSAGDPSQYSYTTVSKNKLWLLAEKEIGVTNTNSVSSEYNNLTAYSLFTMTGGGNHRKKNFNGTATGWWLYSPYSGGYNCICYVKTDGKSANSQAGTFGIAFGFRMGKKS